MAEPNQEYVEEPTDKPLDTSGARTRSRLHSTGNTTSRHLLFASKWTDANRGAAYRGRQRYPCARKTPTS